MARIESAFFDLAVLDRLAGGETSIHRLDPRAKLLTTFAFIVCVVSFGPYQVLPLLPFLIFPIFLVARAGLPVSVLLKKLALAAPFALAVGIFNPIFDREILLHIGPLGISAGWVSFCSIALRILLTLSAVLILVATTGFATVCLGLEKLGAPRPFVQQLLFLYRYLFLLVDEGSRLVRARRLRSFGRRGLELRPYAALLGQLLLRTLARAQAIHRAMLSRGFNGRLHRLQPLNAGASDWLFLCGWCGLFLLLRSTNLPLLLGQLITGGHP